MFFTFDSIKIYSRFQGDQTSGSRDTNLFLQRNIGRIRMQKYGILQLCARLKYMKQNMLISDWSRSIQAICSCVMYLIVTVMLPGFWVGGNLVSRQFARGHCIPYRDLRKGAFCPIEDNVMFSCTSCIFLALKSCKLFAVPHTIKSHINGMTRSWISWMVVGNLTLGHYEIGNNLMAKHYGICFLLYLTMNSPGSNHICIAEVMDEKLQYRSPPPPPRECTVDMSQAGNRVNWPPLLWFDKARLP